MEFDAHTGTIAVALDDNTAHRLSVSTGDSMVLAQDVLEPEFLTAIAGNWLYASRSASGISIRSAPSSQELLTVLNDSVPPTDLIHVGRGLVLLSQHGTISFAPANEGPPAEVVGDIKGVAPLDADSVSA